MELQDLKQKIQDLINKATEDNNNQKKTLSFLFDKLGEVKELETIDRLRKFQGGNKYLLAYLTYKSIVRANFQPELTEHTKYDEDEGGQDKLLEAHAQDIEEFEKQQEKKAIVPAEEPSDRKLLYMLTDRLQSGKIKRELTQFGKFIIIEDEQGILKVDLERGILEPDPAQELLKKHGIINDRREGRRKEGVAFKLNLKEPNTANIEYSEDFEKYVEEVSFGMPKNSLYIVNSEDYKSKNFKYESIVFNGRFLLKLLSNKLKNKEIDREWNGAELPWSGSSAGSGEGGSKYLFFRDDKGTVKLSLWNGKLTETSIAEAVAEAIHGEDENKKN